MTQEEAKKIVQEESDLLIMSSNQVLSYWAHKAGVDFEPIERIDASKVKWKEVHGVSVNA